MSTIQSCCWKAREGYPRIQYLLGQRAGWLDFLAVGTASSSMELNQELVRRMRIAAVVLPANAIAAAVASEHLGGLQPCKLCLEQRLPYYVGVPLLVMALFFSSTRGWKQLESAALLYGFAAVLFLYGAVLGSYHAGAEWGWWTGPSDCGAAFIGKELDAASLLDQIRSTAHVSCSEPAIRILGLSLAGWNTLASATTALLSAACGYVAGKDSRRTLP